MLADAFFEPRKAATSRPSISQYGISPRPRALPTVSLPAVPSTPPAALRRLPPLALPSKASFHTDARDVVAACNAICQRDPRVAGRPAALAAHAQGKGITSAQQDQVLLRWEMAKLLSLLPAVAMQRVSGLTAAEFQQRDPSLVAKILARKREWVGKNHRREQSTHADLLAPVYDGA